MHLLFRSGRRFRLELTVFALLGAGSWLSASPAQASPFTPAEWQQEIRIGSQLFRGKLVRWNRDTDHNFVDDLIDAKPADERVDVIVDFNRCVSCDPANPTLQALAQYGSIEHVGTVVTVALVSGVRVADTRLIAQLPEVAMVELSTPATVSLTNSVQAIAVQAGALSLDTVEDARPQLDGSGVNIAVLDTGVDNEGGPGTTHTQFFPAGTFPAGTQFGADCTQNPCTLIDPDDVLGHGTAVAGVALGRVVPQTIGTTGTRGVAPGAGLVDIKVCDSSGSCASDAIFRGVELAIRKRTDWRIRVLNLSIQDCTPSNGLNAEAQLLNAAVASGIFVAVGVGNTGDCGLSANAHLINDWAAASFIMTVGAIDDGNTAVLNDDALATFSLTGPRADDGDFDDRDEKKPEISAPGAAIRTARFNTADSYEDGDGTSFAAAHVAGVAALLIQDNSDINPGSLKELLISTARSPGFPGAWHSGRGFGFLDAYAAVVRTITTDIGRPENPPYQACNGDWCSPSILLASPPRIGQPNTVVARVHNFGPGGAQGVRVCFGAYVLSNNSERFHDLGCETRDLSGGTIPVSFEWTPDDSLRPPGVGANEDLHVCLQVEIHYPFDSNFTNNTMRRNVTVAHASVVRVPFRLENNRTAPATYTVAIEKPSTWGVRLLENGQPARPSYLLDPEKDCPVDLEVEITPPGSAPPGTHATVFVRAFRDGEVEDGGAAIDVVVSIHDCNGNGVDDAEDLEQGTSQDLNSNQVPDECEILFLQWYFSGIAAGGSVSATLSGVGGACTVSITTVVGQSAAEVVAAFAAAVNADSCLTGQGITAGAAGGVLTVRGLDLRLLGESIDDPGLQHRMPAVTIPTASSLGLATLAALLAVAGIWFVAQRRRLRSRS